MKRFIYSILSTSVILSVTACNHSVIEQQEYAYFSASVSNNDEPEVVFKSEGSEPVFTVRVLDAATGEQAGISDNAADLQTTPLNIRPGTYRAEAYSGTNPDAGWECPYYFGTSTEFTMVEGDKKNIPIECEIANVKVNVFFAQNIVDNFDTYTFTVTTGDGASLVFDASTLSDTDGGKISKSGYFKVPTSKSLSWTLKLVNKHGEENIVSSTEEGLVFNEVSAKQFYNFRFSLGSSPSNTGGAYLKLICNSDLTEKNEGTKEIILDNISDGNLPEITATHGGEEILLFFTNDIPQNTETATILNVASASEITVLSFTPANGSETDILTSSITGVTVASASEGYGKSVNITEYLMALEAGEHTAYLRATNAKGSVYQPIKIRITQ